MHGRKLRATIFLIVMAVGTLGQLIGIYVGSNAQLDHQAIFGFWMMVISMMAAVIGAGAYAKHSSICFLWGLMAVFPVVGIVFVLSRGWSHGKIAVPETAQNVGHPPSQSEDAESGG